jgi:predicted DNA-binding transcriptional regulator YafY
MARNEQLIRQLKVLQLLEHSRYGKRLEELCEELVESLGLTKLSDRTVRRDIEALQAVGFDVDSYESPRGTVWKLGPGLKSIPKIEATATELLALSVVRELLVPMTGTVFWQGLETLWQKMQDSLPEPVWKHFDKTRKNLLVRGTPAKTYADQQGVVATLQRAILQHRVMEIAYRSGGAAEATLRRVEPLSLTLYNGSLYLVAAAQGAPAETAIRHYKLDRFDKATALDEYFEPPEDYDPDEHFHHSLGIYKAKQLSDFRIRLADHVVAWVSETPWHAEQRIERDEAGRAILVIPNAYQEEIVPKVLALGSAAVVLEPLSCRDEVRRVLRESVEQYAD